jgi:hypothetical protein
MPESANKAIFELPKTLRAQNGLQLKNELRGLFSPCAKGNVVLMDEYGRWILAQVNHHATFLKGADLVGFLEDQNSLWLELSYIGENFYRIVCRTPKVSMQVAEEYVYLGFYFRCIFRSYEKNEKMLLIVLNSNNGQVQLDFPIWWQKTVPAEKPEYALPQASRWSVEKLYQAACQEVENMAQSQAARIAAEVAGVKQKELDKIAGYYRELTLDLKKKLRGTEDPDKKSRLIKQLAATEADQERRQKDANERYGVEVEAHLDHIVAYHVPCVRVKLEIQHKGEVMNYTVLYNPLAGEIETPICKNCGRTIVCLVPDRGRLVCAECLTELQ